MTTSVSDSEALANLDQRLTRIEKAEGRLVRWLAYFTPAIIVAAVVLPWQIPGATSAFAAMMFAHCVAIWIALVVISSWSFENWSLIWSRENYIYEHIERNHPDIYERMFWLPPPSPSPQIRPEFFWRMIRGKYANRPDPYLKRISKLFRRELVLTFWPFLLAGGSIFLNIVSSALLELSRTGANS